MGSKSAEANTSGTFTASAATSPSDPAPQAAAADESAAKYSAEALTFDLLQNAAYHADRLAHFTRMHRAISFLTILLGTGGVTAAIAKSQEWGVAIGVAIAVLSSLDLAFDFRSQARTHERLRERVFGLLADLDEANGNVPDLLRVRADLTRLYGEEAADMCAVNAIAYNSAVQATQRNVNPDDLIPLTFMQRAARHWARMPGEYLTSREIKHRTEGESDGRG